MKELIKEYQANGNREVIEKIEKYIDQDLLKYGYDENESFNNDVDGLIYIAIKIRAHLLKECYQERNFRFKYQSSTRDKADYKALFGEKDALDSDFFDESKEKFGGEEWKSNDGFGVKAFDKQKSSWIDDLKKKEWLEVNVDEMKAFDFSSVWANQDKLKEHYEGEEKELFILCKKFTKMSPNSDEFKADFKETKEKILPTFIEALEYALSKVDASRNDKEIVKYVNRAMMTKFIELTIKETGVKRIRENGESHYIKPVFHDDIDNKVWMMIIGKSLSYVGADAFDEYLTKSQRELINQLYGLVEIEYKAENVEFFHWDKNGNAYLNKRKVAELIGVGEANLNQKLKRIENNIHNNWAVVWEKNA